MGEGGEKGGRGTRGVTMWPHVGKLPFWGKPSQIEGGGGGRVKRGGG